MYHCAGENPMETINYRKKLNILIAIFKKKKLAIG